MASPHQINMGLYFNKSVVPFGINVKKCWSAANSARSSEKRFTPYNERENDKRLEADKIARQFAEEKRKLKEKLRMISYRVRNQKKNLRIQTGIRDHSISASESSNDN